MSDSVRSEESAPLPGIDIANVWVSGESGPLPAAGLFMHCGVGVKR